MPGRIRGNEYRTTLVCVDGGRSGDFAGRLYNPFWEGGAVFEGTLDFLEKMEDLLDQMQLPQSFTAKRSFGAPEPVHTMPQPPPERRQGQRATFAVRVLFRQNASWQGTVIWQETGREEAFRSVLELLLLMSSAISAKSAGRFSVLRSKTEGNL